MSNQTTAPTPPSADRPVAARGAGSPAPSPRRPSHGSASATAARLWRGRLDDRPGPARRCSGSSPAPPCCTSGTSARRGWANSFYAVAAQAGSESWKAMFSDPSPTLAQFKQYVANGEIHYFIASGTSDGGGGMSAGGSTSSSIFSWVRANFTAETVDGVTVYDLSSGVR